VTRAAEIEAQITEIVEDMAPGLVTAGYGLGYLSAAQILLSWSCAGRIRTEQAFAMLPGTAPVPVSEGASPSDVAHALGIRLARTLPHEQHWTIIPVWIEKVSGPDLTNQIRRLQRAHVTSRTSQRRA
jgi:hypothetical protein